MRKITTRKPQSNASATFPLPPCAVLSLPHSFPPSAPSCLSLLLTLEASDIAHHQQSMPARQEWKPDTAGGPLEGST